MVNVDLTYYSGKKVFLTGHTGFKGTWLLCMLNKLGATVRGYALSPISKNDLFHEIGGDKLCDSVIANILQKEKLEKEVCEFQPDVVFHFAAQPLVRLSYKIPAETFEVNVMGTVYLLEAIGKLDNPCNVILITTDKVYENKEWQYPYREIDPLGGYDPYSASKSAAEMVISSYRNSFFNTTMYGIHSKAIAVARAGNVIGGGDYSADRIIPDIVFSLRKNEPIVIRNPDSVRPWQHVLEPLTGYLKLGQMLSLDPINFATAWNFGPKQEDNLTVWQLAGIAVDIWGSGSVLSKLDKRDFHEAGLLKLDISKTQAQLKWNPLMDARQSVEMTINWYRRNVSGNAYELIMKDLDYYFKIIQ